MKKRLLAWLLTLVLLLALLPTAALAAEPVATGTCGATGNEDNVTWKLEQNNKDNENPTYTLTISGTGAIKDDPANKTNWSTFAKQITQIVIGEGITSIGGNLIRGTRGATVYIPKTVTEIKHNSAQTTFNNGSDVRIVLDPENANYIMENGVLFTADKKTLVKYTMDAPVSYTVPDGVVTIAAKSMALVSKLESVSLAESVTTIEDYAFQSATGLTEFTFPDTVTSIGAYLFQNSGVKSIRLGHGLTTVHNYAFWKAINLEYAFISNTVTSLGNSAFQETALKHVEFEETSVLETIGTSAFNKCTQLEQIELPASVKTISGDAFNGCSALTDIKLNDGLQTIGQFAFRNCDSLTYIEIPSTVTSFAAQFKGFYAATVYSNILHVKGNHGGIMMAPYNVNDDIKVGWYGVDGTFYDTGDESGHAKTPITEKTTVYAVYSGKTSFDSNGGEGSMTAIDSYYAPGLAADQTITLADKTCTIPANTFTNEGHVFVWWNTAADSTGLTYHPGDDLPASKQVETLYAQWGVQKGESVYFVYPTIDDQTYTGLPLMPAVRVVKDGVEVNEGFTVEYVNNVNVGMALAIVKVDGKVIGTATFQIVAPPPAPVTPVIPVTPSAPAKNPFNLDAGKTKFTDVSDNAWYASAVNYAVDKGLMNGTGDNKFSPEADTTRGMIVTILARLDGKNTSGNPWYQAGQRWAMEYEISDGTNMTSAITREQLVTMLFRYAVKNGLEAVTLAENLSRFTDASSVSDWAVPAMQWAVGQGLIQGSNGLLRPQANASRAEVATILMRFCELLNK